MYFLITDDKDRPCRIGCQDASIAYRFYMVNGEEGWFPGGTDCSRGDQDKKAYCMAGKCVVRALYIEHTYKYSFVLLVVMCSRFRSCN